MYRIPRPRPRKGRSRPATAALAAVAVLATLLVGAAPGAAAAEDPAPVLIDRFEGEVPLGNTPPADAIFTWGGNATDHPQLRLAERADAPEGEQVLEGSYDISAYGGFSHEFAVDTPPQDWT
ncbi:carbohydrate binding domain-containing protein, partial [Streptomyces sp. DSM 41979]